MTASNTQVLTASLVRPAPVAWTSAAAAATIAMLCLWFSHSGLKASMTGDDLMNIYGAWTKPVSQLIRENLLFFTPGYRPLGNLVYRILFELFGLNALPYRLFCYALILGNLYILYRAAAAIASKETALLAALLSSFNAGFVDLYYNTGTIYDLLCYTFYFLALGLYASVRKRGELLTPVAWASFLTLYSCALNSKEMAVTLPLVLVIYEWTLGRSQARRWWPATITALMTVPYAIAKFSAASAFSGIDAYKHHISFKIYLQSFAHYLTLFTYLPPETLNVAASLLTLLLLATLMALGRQRCLIFLWFFILISPLPAVFIPPRGGYAMYVPSFGLALFTAVLLVRARKALACRIAGPGLLRLQTRRLLQLDTFAICAIVLFSFHSSEPLPLPNATDQLIRTTAAQVHTVLPAVDPRAKIVFTDDPFPKEGYDLTYILRLSHRAPELIVDRVKTMPAGSPPLLLANYNYVLHFEGRRLAKISPN